MTIFITGRRRQVLISICIYIGQMLVGFTISWTIPILPKLQDPEQSPLPDLLTEAQLSLVASLLYVGCLPGPYVVGWLANVKGRKPCLILGGAVTIVGYIILGTSNSLAMLYCGRIVAGFGLGAIGVINLVYIGEIATTEIRGMLLTVGGIFTTSGLIVLLLAGYFSTYSGTTFVGLAISVVFTATALFIPETPIFHMLKGDEEAVRKVLQELGRTDDINSILAARKEFIQTSARKDWVELFSVKSNRKALFIVIIVNILQHCSGVMAVIFFASIIFGMAGSSLDSNLSMLIIAGFQLLGSFVSSFLVERTGRKILLITSSAICSLSMLLLGTYFYLDHIGNSIVDNIKWLPLFILVLFFIGYDFGLGIIPNVLMGEMFTTNVRSKGSAVTMTTAWVAGFCITTAFGALVETVGGHVAFWPK